MARVRSCVRTARALHPRISSARELADAYSKESGTPRAQASSLIRWQIAKTASSGFLTGLGGVLTILITLPADLGSAYFIQLRMIAAIAYMGGYDAKSEQVRTLSYVCLPALAHAAPARPSRWHRHANAVSTPPQNREGATLSACSARDSQSPIANVCPGSQSPVARNRVDHSDPRMRCGGQIAAVAWRGFGS